MGRADQLNHFGEVTFAGGRYLAVDQKGIGRVQPGDEPHVLSLRQQVERLMGEGSTTGQITGETNQGAPHGSRLAQNDVSPIRTWLALDSPFGSLQAGLSSLHLVDEEQDRSVDNTERRT